MNDTKEKILTTALRLFARDGYEAVPVSEIAGELGITKGALYRHYASKRAIFDSIVDRMKALDYERAVNYEMPSDTVENMADAYENTELSKLCEYTLAQFSFWTEEELPSQFRRMLTLEQYRSAEMSCLYCQYISAGPLGYTESLFRGMKSVGPADARRLALSFYAPVFLLYSIYDSSDDKQSVKAELKRQLERFMKTTEEMK